MSNKPDPVQLEAELRAALATLPMVKAPATLKPRVLQAVKGLRVRPWWERELSAWPTPFRGLFWLLAALLLGGGLWGLAVFQTPDSIGVSDWIGYLPAEWAAQGQQVLGAAAALGRMASDLFGWLTNGMLLGALGVVALSFCLCIGLGTVAYRVLRDQDPGGLWGAIQKVERGV